MAKYGEKAQKKVKRAIHEMKKGKLKSGKSRKKVTSRTQAIAIGLSEARKEGGKVPLPPKTKAKKKKSTKAKKASSAKKKSLASKKRAAAKKNTSTTKKKAITKRKPVKAKKAR